MRALLVAFAAACTAAAPVADPRSPDGVVAMIDTSRDLDGAVVGASDARATIAVVFASWCAHCRRELGVIGALRAVHPGVRVIGLNYRGHEEYDRRGNPDAVRRYIAESAPWLRVVPADEPLFTALGRPPMVPTIVIYDRTGRPVARYDRRERALPDAAELDELLRSLGA